jgi:hypothetical protein
VRKYVATTAPLSSGWANATRIDGDLAEFAPRPQGSARSRDRRPASISVVRSLLAAGLIDELKLVISPTIAGAGRRLLEDLPATLLELIDAKPAPSGSLLAHYRVIR